VYNYFLYINVELKKKKKKKKEKKNKKKKKEKKNWKSILIINLNIYNNTLNWTYNIDIRYYTTSKNTCNYNIKYYIKNTLKRYLFQIVFIYYSILYLLLI